MTTAKRSIPDSQYLIALILAVGLSTALNVMTVAVLYDALFSDAPGLSENATQILTGWGGGIVGILGAVFGYRVGEETRQHRKDDEEETP